MRVYIYIYIARSIYCICIHTLTHTHIYILRAICCSLSLLSIFYKDDDFSSIPRASAPRAHYVIKAHILYSLEARRYFARIFFSVFSFAKTLNDISQHLRFVAETFVSCQSFKVVLNTRNKQQTKSFAWNKHATTAQIVRATKPRPFANFLRSRLTYLV